MSGEQSVDALLDFADAERSAGRGEAAARLYDEAIERCRAAGDLPGWTRAAFGAAAGYVFGTDPGRLPAQLHDLLVRTPDHAGRARVAAALARCWAYAGQPERAARFADEAVQRAEEAGAADVEADALDAALAVRWGPDDLDTRQVLARRLDEVSAHVLDPRTRLQARLWGLQVACETLDLPAMHRHMRALERLGEESLRAQFFAASRRLMLDLLRARFDTAPQLIAVAERAGEGAGLADAWMVVESMRGYTAAFAGDSRACGRLAAACEEFATAEGVPAVAAEAAFLWATAGRPDRSRALLGSFAGTVLDDLPRDMNWLLTLQCVLQAALATGTDDLASHAAALLAPYAGRAVFNVGAVMFHGVTDDPLGREAALRGDTATATGLLLRALATYRRIGASWWRAQLEQAMSGAGAGGAQVATLRPTGGGLWLVGAGGAAAPVRGLRGFSYVHALLRRPGEDIDALDLVGGAETVIEHDVGEVLDQQARDAYRRRLHDLDAELAEAQEWADLGRRDRLQAEHDALVAELAAATGLGGRVRRAGGSGERARVAARKAIIAAIERIAAVEPPLGEHLRRTVHTGRHCSYRPGAADAVQWQLG